MPIRYGPHLLPLPEGETLLGRSLAADVPIPSPMASRRHARIVVAGEKAILEDLGSKNGTWVNGRRLEGALDLADGDAIGVGGLTLFFRTAPLDATAKTNHRA